MPSILYSHTTAWENTVILLGRKWMGKDDQDMTGQINSTEV
jgi:hypothetical protein